MDVEFPRSRDAQLLEKLRASQKKVIFGCGFLSPITPKPCIAVDQAIKSKQRKQKITQIYHKPYICINTEESGRSLALFIHKHLTKICLI